ncbi:MAG: hypothetical protein Q7U33_09300 [Methylotenera sp.]|jgi:hypothetical protein|uniref:surface-adhesin E family protein n=1 Tax=Methylotenera sp. TaxID=2051956 RepID=UPI00271FA382|nr:surface-adhesin E family protein [Methylotenera sp.]MDO9151559.1 hypothetical protein [Methylotenera sp.]
MSKYLMMLVLVFISSKAFAEWTMIQTNDNGNMLIDFDTVQKAENLITVSTLNDYYVQQPKGEMSSEWLELHDCKNKQFKALSIKYYAENMAKGSLLATYHLPESETAWSAVVPYSIGEVKANVICSR